MNVNDNFFKKDDAFFMKMYHIYGRKANTSYNVFMEEISFDWERIMPYEAKQPDGHIYYEYSKIKKEMPDKCFWLNLCIKTKEIYQKRLCLTKIFFNHGESDAFFIKKKLNETFKHIGNYSEEINNFFKNDDLTFFIYFETEEDLNYPPLTELCDLVANR